MSSSSIDLGVGTSSGGGGGSGTVSGNLSTMIATTGVNGQSFFNTTYTAYFDWVTDRWVPRMPDPRYGFILFDEFIGSDRIGMLDWQTNSAVPVAGNLLNVGQYKTPISTSSNSCYLAGQTNTTQFGTGDFYCETCLVIPTLSNGTDNVVCTFGWNDNPAYDVHGACTDGAFFTYDTAISSTHWNCYAFSNGASTSSATAAPVVAGTYNRLGILVSANNSNVTFYVNGSLSATITTNIPTGAGRQTGWMFKCDKTAGLGSLQMNFDYFYTWGFYNGQRVS